VRAEALKIHKKNSSGVSSRKNEKKDKLQECYA